MKFRSLAWYLLLVIGFGFHPTCLGELEDSLHYFELLHDEQINHRISKRSVGDEDDIVEKDVTFQSFGREFNLKLTKRVGLFSPGFKAFALDKHQKKRSIEVDTDNIFKGYDKSQPWSSVATAFWDDRNSLTAMIKTKYETYMIEPAWRHLENVQNDSMIAYKESDLKWDKDLGKKYCDFVNPEQENYTSTAAPEPEQQTPTSQSHDDDIHERYKRQAQSGFSFKPKKTTCPLLLVADYRFFRTMGQNSLSLTTSYLIGLVDRVDTIYRGTDFGKGFMGMGFEIKEIRVHEAPTAVTGKSQHYNEERDLWKTKELLEVFAQNDTHVHYCMSHLFTALKFPMGTLGLSYLASPFRYNPGGICSPVYYKGGNQLYLNTGWSSSLNRYKRRLLTSEADLVTTHEFGHNWGSEHDPDTQECSPSSYGGGKYIMYTYSVSGYDQNNKIFSPCSRRAISTVLEAKHDVCFKEPSDGFCGNMRVEGDEDCDPGPSVKKDLDRCCNKYCKFRGNAECSDVNSICCDNCQFAASSKVCHSEQEGSCDDSAYCTGSSAICPTPEPKNDGTECIGGGKCMGGVCQALCESNGLSSCICDTLEQSCTRCCRDPRELNATCRPYQPNGQAAQMLPDGVACIQGYCLNGICEKQNVDLVERIWDIIEDITRSNFVDFMRANIVGTVIVFSLVLWIPLSCVISYFDRKRKREERERVMWHSNDNKDLYSDFDRNTLTIKKSKRIRHREPITPVPQLGEPQSEARTRVLKAYPPPQLPPSDAPPPAPTARISETSYDEPDLGLPSPDLDNVDESPFELPEIETTFTETLPLLPPRIRGGIPRAENGEPAPAAGASKDNNYSDSEQTLMRGYSVSHTTMDNNIHIRVEDKGQQKMNQAGGSDTSLLLPEYVWKPDPKGRTEVSDLPPENLSKVQDFLKLMRKELDRYYRLHSHQRKGSFVGTPKSKKEKFALLKPDLATVEFGGPQRVFGVPLEKLLEYDREREPDKERTVPRFFEELINHLDTCVREEGLLRKAGQEKRVKELKEIINADFYDPNGAFYWRDVAPHNAASLLKHFLKDLPVKLLSTPGEHPDAFLKVQGIPGVEDQLKALHLLVLLITDVQRDTLRLLLRFLKNIVDNHKENKMTPGNVAVVMAPNLFPFDVTPGRDFEKVNQDNIFSNKAVQMLVKYQDILWTIPQFVLTEIRRKFGSQQGLLNTSLSPMSWGGSLKHKVPQILQETYFYELVKIKVTIPHLGKTTKVELEENTTAQDVIDRFAVKLYKKTGSGAQGVVYHLYEVGGTIDERKLPLDSHILSIHADNPTADWVIK